MDLADPRAADRSSWWKNLRSPLLARISACESRIRLPSTSLLRRASEMNFVPAPSATTRMSPASPSRITNAARTVCAKSPRCREGQTLLHLSIHTCAIALAKSHVATLSFSALRTARERGRELERIFSRCEDPGFGCPARSARSSKRHLLHFPF